MNALETYLQTLVDALAEVERDMANKTLSHSDQQILDQAWEFYTQRIAMVEDLLANLMEDTREGCARCSGCTYCEASPGYDPSDEI
jgi:ADP-dependent phosphofructokinase/glucokinase